MNYTGPFTNTLSDEILTTTESTLADPAGYNLNTTLRVKPLRSDRLIIVPLIPSLHAEAVWKKVKDHPSMAVDAGVWDWRTKEGMLGTLEETRRREYATLSVILISDTAESKDDDAADPSWDAAGLIGAHTDQDPLKSASQDRQLGPVIIFPEYQGTGLLHEAGLLYLDHLFEEPEVSKVTWGSLADNYRSRCAALALGFPDSTKQRFPPDSFAKDLTDAYLTLTGNEFPGIWAFDLSREEWISSAKPALERRVSARRALPT